MRGATAGHRYACCCRAAMRLIRVLKAPRIHIVSNCTSKSGTSVATTWCTMLQQGPGSGGNAQLVEQTLALDAAINRRDASQIGALLSDDIVIHHGEQSHTGSSCTASAHPAACNMRHIDMQGVGVLRHDRIMFMWDPYVSAHHCLLVGFCPTTCDLLRRWHHHGGGREGQRRCSALVRILFLALRLCVARRHCGRRR